MINLKTPIRSEKVRAGFQPHWRTVFVYKCEKCGGETRIYANSFQGKYPTPGIGGVYCHCEVKQP
jgi:hypothetical protein